MKLSAKIKVPIKLNAKAAIHKIFSQNKIIPKKTDSRPSYLKRYPNMNFNRNKIIHYMNRPKGKLDFTDVTQLPKKIEFSKIRLPTKLTEEMPPQHDYINFKNMTGNEILYNMTNYEHLRNGEIVSCLYEFSKRVNLPENRETKLLKEIKWIKHLFVKPLYNRLVFKLPTLNLKNLIVTILAFDNLRIDQELATWKRMEFSLDRHLHKLKPSQIVLLLEMLNRHTNRTSKEFLNKLLTIIPIHIESLKDEELLTLMKVCIQQDLVSERLFSYFIYPRVEQRVKRFRLGNYFRLLRLLSNLHYEEDPEFWNGHILPCIFNYDYNAVQIRFLWEAMLKVKVECPNVDVSKHLLLIENVMKQFENLKASGQDIEGLLLKLEQDMTLLPVQKKTFSYKEAKEAEKRLKDKATLKQFMEKFNAQEDDESRAQEAQLNINKLLEVKDWKKARYEINLAEMEKLKRPKEETEETAPQDGIVASATVDAKVEVEDKPQASAENIENIENADSEAAATEEPYNEHLEKRLKKEKMKADKKSPNQES